jgi:shikimate kinase
MSGVGKTTWAQKLEETGYTRYSCDDAIEEKLADELTKLGYRGINDLAKWLGQPYEPQYNTNEQRYLDLEKESVEEALEKVASLPDDSRFVLDTTGSVIYMTDELLDELAEKTKIIYLETPEAVQQQMCENYFQDPKPVIWNGVYTQNPGEDETASLRRCYPELLKKRTQVYQRHAHVTIPYEVTWDEGFGVEDFLTRIGDE